jgi:hypothetical protein
MRIWKSKEGWAVVAAILALAGGTKAQAEVATNVCNFVETCAREEGCKETEFLLTFFVDREDGTAYMQGNIGLTDVLPFETTRSVSFVEFVDSGVVQATTIFPDGTGVHSRHTMLGDAPFPSQMHGSCTRFGA